MKFCWQLEIQIHN